jgi:hypothetical protein
VAILLFFPALLAAVLPSFPAPTKPPPAAAAPALPAAVQPANERVDELGLLSLVGPPAPMSAPASAAQGAAAWRAQAAALQRPAHDRGAAGQALAHVGGAAARRQARLPPKELAAAAGSRRAARLGPVGPADQPPSAGRACGLCCWPSLACLGGGMGAARRAGVCCLPFGTLRVLSVQFGEPECRVDSVSQQHARLVRCH